MGMSEFIPAVKHMTFLNRHNACMKKHSFLTQVVLTSLLVMGLVSPGRAEQMLRISSIPEEAVATVLLAMLVLVLAVDQLSAWLRQRL
jgi:ABC-type phosphate/phosphonate transport system permease subunit